MAEARHPATPGALPKELATEASELFGRELVVRWCEALLAGTATDDDAAWPHIEWLGGTVGWRDYWARVWGARGLLHIGPPEHPSIVIDALADEHWRVREMSLKVVRRHGLDDPEARVDALVDDPVERVRLQAWTTLGVPAPEGHRDAASG